LLHPLNCFGRVYTHIHSHNQSRLHYPCLGLGRSVYYLWAGKYRIEIMMRIALIVQAGLKLTQPIFFGQMRERKCS
jgi:hypothetical protein